MDMARWGHAFEPHRMLDLTGLADPAAAVREAVASQALRPPTS
jgi:hypothetical protein